MATQRQIEANRFNAKLSTGPKTAEGKEASRSNALKHGLTATKLIPEREAAEVQRRYLAFREELKPSGEVGMALARQAAMMSVRTERCFEHENAVLTERVRRAEADFVAPEGLDEATAARLRTEAGKRALFDTSKEATLARKYEAAAQRGFFLALKELRAIERARKAAEEAKIDEELASFSPGDMTDDEFNTMYAEFAATNPGLASDGGGPVDLEAMLERIGIPFSVGKPR